MDTMNASILTVSLVNIKTPQLIGIIAGVLVFSITVIVVFILLYKSGTFGRFVDEMREGKPLVLDSQHIAPVLSQYPELYDSLLLARQILPITPEIEALKGKMINIKQLEEEDCMKLLQVCDGRAIFNESAYDPLRLWGWVIFDHLDDDAPLPIHSLNEFKSAVLCSQESTKHGVIVDNILETPIGLFTLSNNSPKNLSVQLEHICVTPAYQGTKSAHEAVFLILQVLFRNGYRRIYSECDFRNVIGRKFLERCGFRLEAVMRKHRIFKSRNRDTAFYVLLNSDWEELEVKFKKYLGISLKPKMHKIAEIGESCEVLLRSGTSSHVVEVSVNPSVGEHEE
jgi:RimJ/RimL family protein N-acetyltransferase